MLSARAAENRAATARLALRKAPQVAKALLGSHREYYIDQLTGDQMPMGNYELGNEIPWVPTY